ncbi:MAG: PASTA domain-containing protein [Deltaproteobacteria bacterium]|jgi:hypothetical protein|nr:PASTA domain-containing protein [Deltaproteobacteria bacterium]
MTDHAGKQFQRRQKSLPHQRRKRQRCLLLALVLIIGSGAFVFHTQGLNGVSVILTRLTETNSGEVVISASSATPRGNIYDRNFRPLAATYQTYTIYARPLEMEDPAATAAKLEKILGFEQKNLLSSLKSERGFVWIAKGIDQELADTVKSHNIKGIYQVVETKRYYPNYETAAHAVGFVEDDQGLDGIEFKYNSLLKGGEKSRKELEALNISSTSELGQTASNLVLNLDLLIQSKVERYLTKRIKITGATGGCILLMNAHTGQIYSMASFPAFNPNRYWEFSSSALKNHLLSEPVYPGELALIFQQAAAINFRNQKKSQAMNDLTAGVTIPVIEPEILKRRKLSVAPQIDTVDPEYFAGFAQLLGFYQEPVTDIPLKDEIPEASSFLLTDPLFNSSALRLLTGFTALVNNGKIVTPHLLNKAYPGGNSTPIELNLADIDQTGFLHPDTSSELIDFLASKWLKMNSRDKTSKAPMFFEAHRYAKPVRNHEQSGLGHDVAHQADQLPRIMQSVMLGAIPGKNPKLTMITVLSYSESTDDIYPDALESLGSKFSILKPDQNMIQKILYMAEQRPPVPSADFWSSSGSGLAKNIDSPASEKTKSAVRTQSYKKRMPDVTGKSLRAGLQTLQHFNLDIRLVGSGKIIGQQPAAGSELKNSNKCVLEMGHEI